jgi:NTE family protein
MNSNAHAVLPTPDEQIEVLTPVARGSAAARAQSRWSSDRRRQAARARPPRTAFVLSGGASLAALQAGMLHALYEKGITADLFVATSAGAINAAFVASRPQTVATARALGRIWRELKRDDVFPVSPWVLATGLLGKRDHLIAAAKLRKLLVRYLEFDDLADAPIPLHIVACDVNTGADVLLSAGAALEAITASAAIPGVYPPVRIGDRRLMDGGVVNNTPISHAVALGAERVYVLPTVDRSFAGQGSRRAPLGAAMDALGVMMGTRLEADIAHFSSQVELIVLPAPNALAVLPTDFSHADRLMRDALHAARRQLAAVGEGLTLVESATLDGA